MPTTGPFLLGRPQILHNILKMIPCGLSTCTGRESLVLDLTLSKRITECQRCRSMIHTTEQARHWFQTICKVCRFFIQEEKGKEYPKIVQLLVAIGVTAATIFTMLIWLANIGSCIHLDIAYSAMNTILKKSPKIPVIAWLNHTVIYRPNRHSKISCFNGSRFFGCDVFHPGSMADKPDAYMFYGATLDKVPLPRDRETVWGLFHDETPSTSPVLMHEDALNLFNFSATYSRYSDVPFPLRWMRKLDIITNTSYFLPTSVKKSLLQNIAPIIYLQSDCHSSTERDAYVQQLMEYIPVDSYGRCLQNKELPLSPVFNYLKASYVSYMFDQELMIFLAQYKFIIAIENAVCNDYITEKFWRAMEVGTVPIYFGSPLIRDWLPNNKSAILLEDFPTPELLSRHLHYLLQNDTAYEEYLEHKMLGLILNQNLIDEVAVRPYQANIEDVIKRFECFVCEKLHDGVSRTVNMVTKKHFDCPLPISALTQSVNPDNCWVENIKEARLVIDQMFEENNISKYRLPRLSEISCLVQENLVKILGFVPFFF